MLYGCILKLGATHGVHCDQALDKMPKVGVLYRCTLKLKACMGYIVTRPLAVCQGWSALWMHFEVGGNAWSTL